MISIRRIIFIDKEDICRAPMAYGIATQEIMKRDLDISVDCAGISAPFRSPPTRHALKVCSELGFNLTALRSRPVDAADNDGSTLFVAMDEKLALWLRRVMLFPSERVTFLGAGVSDCYGQELEQYRQTCIELQASVVALFERLRSELPVRFREPEREISLESLAEDGFELSQMSYLDIAQVSALEKEIFTDCWSEGALKDSVESEGTYFYVIKKGMEICGYGCVMVAADTSYIPKIAIAPAFRKRGLAHALLDKLCDEADFNGANEVVLDVRVSNSSAIQLYISNGFTLEGRKPNNFENPHEDGYVYIKRLGMIAKPVLPPSNFFNNGF